jgi:hypothetical protein
MVLSRNDACNDAAFGCQRVVVVPKSPSWPFPSEEHLSLTYRASRPHLLVGQEAGGVSTISWSNEP